MFTIDLSAGWPEENARKADHSQDRSHHEAGKDLSVHHPPSVTQPHFAQRHCPDK